MRTFNRYLKEETDAWIAESEGSIFIKDNQNDHAGEGSLHAGGESKNVMLFDLEKYWRLVLAYPEAFGMTECARYQMTIDDHRVNLGRMGYW